MENPLLMFLLALLTFVYGWLVSWVEERSGPFQGLSSRWKQTINAVWAIVLPYLVLLFQPYWRPEFGDITNVLASLGVLALPLLTWLVTQVAHAWDPVFVIQQKKDLLDYDVFALTPSAARTATHPRP